MGLNDNLKYVVTHFDVLPLPSYLVLELLLLTANLRRHIATTNTWSSAVAEIARVWIHYAFQSHSQFIDFDTNLKSAVCDFRLVNTANFWESLFTKQTYGMETANNKQYEPNQIKQQHRQKPLEAHFKFSYALGP